MQKRFSENNYENQFLLGKLAACSDFFILLTKLDL
jgi:hypothetical protein